MKESEFNQAGELRQKMNSIQNDLLIMEDDPKVPFVSDHLSDEVHTKIRELIFEDLERNLRKAKDEFEAL